MDYIHYLREMVGSEPVIMVTAGVALFDSGKVLLQRRADDGSWGLIGGFMELGETVEEAARREVFEETGLTVAELSLFGVFSEPELLIYPNGDQAQIMTVMFRAGRASGVLQPDAESLELRYFGLEDLPAPLFKPNLPIFAALRRAYPEVKEF